MFWLGFLKISSMIPVLIIPVFFPSHLCMHIFTLKKCNYLDHIEEWKVMINSLLRPVISVSSTFARHYGIGELQDGILPPQPPKKYGLDIGTFGVFIFFYPSVFSHAMCFSMK